MKKRRNFDGFVYMTLDPGKDPDLQVSLDAGDQVNLRIDINEPSA